ncbi:MAG: TerD family protein [Planctomycetota bacterium]
MPSLTQTSIFLTKSLKVIVPAGDIAESTSPVVATTARNLQALGFGLSAPLLKRLATLSDSAVAKWYRSVLPTLKKLVGAHRKFEPFYPNFPKQVMEASDAELYLNAMTHYFGFVLSDMLDDPNLVVLPNYEKEARPILDEFHSLRWIDLGTEDEFDAIFTRLASINGSLSESDRDILGWFASERDVAKLVPDHIPQKETLAFLVATLPQPECLLPSVKTATDVLRIAVAMSDGDVSLAEATKFRNFTKRERRFLLACLESAGASRTEDMLRWKRRWIRLGERLHPGDYRKRFPESLEAFNVLRNDVPFQTFNARIEDAITSRNPEATIGLLTQRPGDFGRRLDHVLRTHDDADKILDAFCRVAPKVSTRVLFQMWHHFHTREGANGRAFFPKGNAAKVQFSEAGLPALPDGLAAATAKKLRGILVRRFGELPSLGNVFLDERLKDQLVPFSQRSASRSLRSVARGSTFDLPEGSTVRFFCWWKNIARGGEYGSRVDLDLSASLFKSNWDRHSDIAYYNLRDGLCYHSGDVTSAPKGACEFIDINLPSVLNRGARYVVMSVLSFTHQPFLALPECFGGWMMREKPKSGEVFEARTVQDKVDITASSRACVPVILDAEARKVYWSDLALKSGAQINNAAQNSVGFSQIGRAIVGLRKPSLHDLFAMHAEARGNIVLSQEDANTVFGLYEGTVNAFDPSVILSDFLM